MREALSSMCTTYRASSFIERRLRGRQHIVLQPAVQVFGIDDVDSPAAKHARQLLLDVVNVEPRSVSRLEFDEDIDVAVGTKVFPHNRAEERKATDVPPPAEVGKLRF